MNRKNIMYFINVVGSLFFMFGFGRVFDPIAPMTESGMNILGIFIGLIWAWSTLDMAWTSILGLIALGFSGFIGTSAAFTAGFGNYANVLLLIFCLAYGAYLDETGLNKTIAYWFLTRKMCIGHPWVLTAMILVTSFVLGLCISLFAVVVMMWNILYNIADALGMKRNEKWIGIMIVGIAIAADLGIMPLPYKPMPLLISSGLMNTLGIEMNVAKFAVMKLAISIPCLILYFMAAKYIFKPDMSKLSTNLDIFSEYRDTKFDVEQKIALFSLVVFFFMMFFPAFAPKTNVVAAFFNKIGTAGCTAMLLAVLCMIRYKGKPLANYRKLMTKGVNWDVVILLAVTIPLGNGLSSADTGIMAWVSQLLEPLFANASPFMFTFVFVIGGLILTQFCHNIALANLLLPIMLTFAVRIGCNPEAAAILLSFTLAMAMASPASSPLGALLFGNKDGITTAECYKYSWVFVVIMGICVMGIGYPLGFLVY